MFFKKSNELEIAESLSANMQVLSNFGELSSAQKRGKALQKIAKAANLLDEVGFEKQARELTLLLDKLAHETPFDEPLNDEGDDEIYSDELSSFSEYIQDSSYSELLSIKSGIEDEIKTGDNEDNRLLRLKLDIINDALQSKDVDFDFGSDEGDEDVEDVRDASIPKSTKQMVKNYATKGWAFNADDDAPPISGKYPIDQYPSNDEEEFALDSADEDSEDNEDEDDANTDSFTHYVSSLTNEKLHKLKSNILDQIERIDMPFNDGADTEHLNFLLDRLDIIDDEVLIRDSKIDTNEVIDKKTDGGEILETYTGKDIKRK